MYLFKSGIFFILFIIFLSNEASSTCRFAPSFSIQDLLHSKERRQEYISNVLYWEGMFHTDGVGYSASSGLTFDGHAINYTTGELANPQHFWSASSKESIHLGLLARALINNGIADALEFFHVPYPLDNNWNTGDKRLDTVLAVLEAKITSYERFNQSFPGFGGFVPWVLVNSSGMIPIPNQWDHKVPGLDNGEMLWGIFAVQYALSLNYSYLELSRRYQNYFNLLTRNVKTVFWDGEGKIRCVTIIKDPYADPTPENYYTEGSCYLDDPYEGELMDFFMDMYVDWENETEREMIWLRKRSKLQAVDYVTPRGNITCQRGWWFSSHEQWK